MANPRCNIGTIQNKNQCGVGITNYIMRHGKTIKIAHTGLGTCTNNVKRPIDENIMRTPRLR